MKRIIAVLLLIFAMILIYLGFVDDMLPPLVTGLGFAATGILFLWELRRRNV